MSTTPSPLRVLDLATKNGTIKVTLGRYGNLIALYLAYPEEFESPVWMIVSMIISEDPFPGYSIEGKEMIWVKNYSENEGIVDILEKAGWIRSTPRTIKQGFLEHPLCEITLDESELAHQCGGCTGNEVVEDSKRFKKCSSCQKAFYCSSECQLADWQEHKKDCKDLKSGRRAEVENRKRRMQASFLANSGFQVSNLD